MVLPASVAVPPVVRRALEALVERLVQRFPRDLLEVRLFGSRARGEARPGSDVDVLVVVRDGAPEDAEERIQAERESVWRQEDEYAQLAAFVLQEKGVPVGRAVRAAIEEGLRARGLTVDDVLPVLGLLVLREGELRRHREARDLLYRNLRDEGVPLWSAGADLWSEEGVPLAGRERDVRFELEQAARALKVARFALEGDEPHGAASRAYYAAFHAVQAALLTENIERSSHEGVLAEFNRLTRANRLLGKAFHGQLDGLFRLRQDADYGRTYVKERDAARAVETAERFVRAAQEYCQRWLVRQEGRG
jgi:uncharacterized protein (UPF0332 family)